MALALHDIAHALALLHRRSRFSPPPRPRTRADCIDGPRPCPWFGCRYHLGSDMVRRNTVDQGVVDRVRLRPHVYAHGEQTCALDVSEDGPHSLAAVGALVGLSARQVLDIERAAMERMRGAMRGLTEDGEMGDVDWFGE